MDRKYLKSSIRAARLSRVLAKSIDLFIVLMLSIFIYPFGLLIALFYISCADSLQKGQSVGKKLMGFSVISLEDGKPCSVKQSFIRNLPFSVPLCFAVFPILGWIITLLLAFGLITFEIYLLYKIDSGHRLGDVMADTSVIAPSGKLMAYNKNVDGWFEESGQSLQQ